MKQGLTMSVIFDAQSANYGEGAGNVSPLKHITRGDGRQYTYISRQAIRSSMMELLRWNFTPTEATGAGDKKVIQFRPDTSIDRYPEIDLFGYMKTEKGKGAKTRRAVVRLSNAISLEPFTGDLDFLTNIGMASRINENNSIVQSELHSSYYAYTVTIDLDRVGIDENDAIDIEQSEKTNRVCAFLDCVEFLYRDIKGRRENLSPVFVIGGVYDWKSPFFENRLSISKNCLNVGKILGVTASVREDTEVGYLDGTFKNEAEIRERLCPVPIAIFFQNLKRKVETVYAGN